MTREPRMMVGNLGHCFAKGSRKIAKMAGASKKGFLSCAVFKPGDM
jgi:hypothetical protein